MTDDQLEAENRKYSNDVRIILKLSSGRIALFGNDRKLHGIYDDCCEVDIHYADVKVEAAPALKSTDVEGVDVSLDDLGI